MERTKLWVNIIDFTSAFEFLKHCLMSSSTYIEEMQKTILCGGGQRTLREVNCLYFTPTGKCDKLFMYILMSTATIKKFQKDTHVDYK